jgi:hypothetical protein
VTCCTKPGHGDRPARLYPGGRFCGECAPATTVQVQPVPEGETLTRAATSGGCRYCGDPAYLADSQGRTVHGCCLAWAAVIADGHPCPSCQARRWLENPRRGRMMPPLPRFLSDGVTPFIPGPPVPPARHLTVVPPPAAGRAAA